MKERTIVITARDMARLRGLLDSVRRFDSRDHRHLAELEDELGRAEVIPGRAPAHVVTMNSEVTVRHLDEGRTVTYKLVFPKDADVARNRLSVLAPLGTALLGYRAGDLLEWVMPGGVRRFRVEHVGHAPDYAAEAA